MHALESLGIDIQGLESELRILTEEFREFRQEVRDLMEMLDKDD